MLCVSIVVLGIKFFPKDKFLCEFQKFYYGVGISRSDFKLSISLSIDSQFEYICFEISYKLLERINIFVGKLVNWIKLVWNGNISELLKTHFKYKRTLNHCKNTWRRSFDFLVQLGTKSLKIDVRNITLLRILSIPTLDFSLFWCKFNISVHFWLSSNAILFENLPKGIT